MVLGLDLVGCCSYQQHLTGAHHLVDLVGHQALGQVRGSDWMIAVMADNHQEVDIVAVVADNPVVR